jgi:hypothetical protein
LRTSIRNFRRFPQRIFGGWIVFGSDILEVAIGVVFLFCLLSLVATAIREFVETKLQVRAVMLERGIRELLADSDGDVAKRLYGHPLISSLFRGVYDPDTQLTASRGIVLGGDKWKRLKLRSSLPAYIPARNFAVALMDLAGAPGGNADGIPLTIERLRAGAAELPNARLRQAVYVAIDHARGDLEQVRLNLENWFDSGMDRVSGWYRKHTQWALLTIGFVLAIGFNVDTIHVARELMKDGASRAVIVAEAQAAVERAKQANGEAAVAAAFTNCTPAPKDKTCAQQKIESLPFPIGWDSQRPVWAWELKGNQWVGMAGRWLGWLLTAIAISLGAPFWFDLLNKIMVIRSTVKPHEKSPEESSEDRQRPESPPAPAHAPLPAPAAAPAEAADAGFTPNRWANATDPEEGDI